MSRPSRRLPCGRLKDERDAGESNPSHACLPLLLLALALLPGCVGVAYDRARVGTPRPVADARTLEPGRTTFRQALERLGPPDLLLRAGAIDRAYWVAWDSDYLKLVVEIPTGSRSSSMDAFILALGSEELHLARLEFGRDGVLRDVQAATFESSRNGQYVALDNRVVTNFLEDRTRALRLVETDDDDEDVELDPKKPQ